MTSRSKKQIANTTGRQPTIAVDPSLSSFEGHAYFEEKADKAKSVLKKVGLPILANKKKN